MRGIIMFVVIGISFLLYFSRTMMVMSVVACIFFTNTIYIRKFFSKQNIRLLRASLVFLSLIYVAYIGALFFPRKFTRTNACRKVQKYTPGNIVGLKGKSWRNKRRDPGELAWLRGLSRNAEV
jgi:hypothetical protein